MTSFLFSILFGTFFFLFTHDKLYKVPIDYYSPNKYLMLFYNTWQLIKK